MVALELVLIACVAAGDVAAMWGGASARLRAFLLAGGAVPLALAATNRLSPRAAPPPIKASAAEVPRAVGSGACQACHPSEHASWHRTFHRTMTRVATPESARGPFAGARVESEGRTVELFTRRNELYARLPDPEIVARSAASGSGAPSATAPLVTRRVLLATGSHHHEVYWVKGERGNELRLVPVTYLIEPGKLVPRRDAFLTPPEAPLHAVRWNSNCIQCHTTLGRPAHDQASDQFASSAAELGIACEACHGAGEAHVRHHQNPVNRYAARFTGAPDPTIVHPARLPADRSSALCGQCHAYFVPADPESWWRDGFTERFEPGDTLERSRTLLEPASFGERSDSPSGPRADADPESAFWGDGTMRVGGREYSAMIESACYQRGQGERRMGCLSCHALHEGDPDDQLRPDGSADAPCGRCHQGIAARASAHSRHRAGSSGNSCVNCHMPHTSYALLKSIRSHRVDSPSAATTAETGRPNACNLCHLDRSLAWTAEQLRAWFGREPAVAPTGEPPSARALEELLAGDAATRAVVADAFGRDAAHATSGNDWQARFLAELLDDPYAAVRFVAARSLGSFPGFETFGYDYVAPPDERRKARRDALLLVRASERRVPELLYDERGLDEARLAALLARRDDRPVSISE